MFFSLNSHETNTRHLPPKMLVVCKLLGEIIHGQGHMGSSTFLSCPVTIRICGMTERYVAHHFLVKGLKANISGSFEFLPCPLHDSLPIWLTYFIVGTHKTNEGMMCYAPFPVQNISVMRVIHIETICLKCLRGATAVSYLYLLFLCQVSLRKADQYNIAANTDANIGRDQNHYLSACITQVRSMFHNNVCIFCQECNHHTNTLRHDQFY